jgi:hypothetical protein
MDSEEEVDQVNLMDRKEVAFAVDVFLLLVDLLRVLENSLVILLMLKRKSSWNTLKIFIFAMASADLIYSTSVLFYTPIRRLFNFPKYTLLRCQIIMFAVRLSSLTSVVMFPVFIIALTLFKQMRCQTVFIVIAAICAIAGILVFPTAYHTNSFETIEGQYYCYYDWTNEHLILDLIVFQSSVEALIVTISVVSCLKNFEVFTNATEEVVKKLPVLFLLFFVSWLPRFIDRIQYIFDFYHLYNVQLWRIFTLLIHSLYVVLKPCCILVFYLDLRKKIENLLSRSGRIISKEPSVLYKENSTEILSYSRC